MPCSNLSSVDGSESLIRYLFVPANLCIKPLVRGTRICLLAVIPWSRHGAGSALVHYFDHYFNLLDPTFELGTLPQL
jgi:hypothetical protein